VLDQQVRRDLGVGVLLDFEILRDSTLQVELGVWNWDLIRNLLQYHVNEVCDLLGAHELHDGDHAAKDNVANATNQIGGYYADITYSID